MIDVSHRITVCHVPSSVSTCDNQEVLLSFKTTVKEVINPTQVANMMELNVNIELTSQTCEDQTFIAKLNDGIRKDSDCHYETPLPFLDSKPCLPNNRYLALHPLHQLKKRLQRNTRYRADYTCLVFRLKSAFVGRCRKPLVASYGAI